ncbi:MAG: hypothetical protein JWM98_586 [Thermoleophilia bacterium]|nr:hypothetical protein [Thermoleophilia bacterium]
MQLADTPPVPAPVHLQQNPRPVPSHGQFVVAAVGSGDTQTLVGTRAGSHFYMARRAGVEDALAAVQLLATKTNTTYAVVDPSPGHTGMTWIIPAFTWTGGQPSTAVAGLAALGGAVTGRSAHLLGLVGPDGVLDARSVPVDPALKAPRG